MRTIFLLPALLSLCGCGSTEPRGTATGKVTMNGTPLQEGTISFENQAKGIALSGQIRPDGSFQLASHKGAGLPVGSYKIAISPAAMLQSADEIPLVGKNPKPPKDVSKSPIPEKYRKSSSSGLTAEVREGTNPPFEFELKK